MASVSWGLPAEEADPLEIDVYHGRYWFLPLWKLFLPPWKLIFYHHGSWFLPPWKVFLFLNGNKPITLTFYKEIKINKEAQCNGIKKLWNFISSSKFISSSESQMARSITTSVSWGLPAEEHDPLRHMIGERSREKLIVWLYDCLCLVATIDASFL